MSEPSTYKPAYRDVRAVVVFLLIAIGMLAVDLSFKSWSFANVAGTPVALDPEVPDRPDLTIPYHEPVTVVPHVLSLQLWANTGAVFGIGKGGQAFFMIVSVLATVFIGYTFARSDRKAWVMHVCLALVLSGALGNLYDRMTFHAVRDMLWLFPGLHLPFGLAWPGGKTDVYPWLFNIADAALVVGVIVLMGIMWKQDDTTEKEEGDADADANADTPVHQ